MKYILLLISFLIISQVSFSQKSKEIPDIPPFRETKTIDYIHISRSIQGDTFHINAGDMLGTVTAFPDTLSKQFSDEIKSSIDLYTRKNYSEAISVLEVPLMNESDNLFIINYYARALYLVDRKKSFEIYKRLVSDLDSLYNSSIDSIKIDLWFREAYWKLGTLYMDNKLWKEAYFEISRFILSISSEKGTPIYCQALEFLTECAYNLYDDDLAKYLAERTLFYDPNNTYVKGLLKKLK
jgi:tetratricopeptide (TPR) repeat protein